MSDPKPDKQPFPIAYSCYYIRNREGEQFAPEHVFSYQISGTLTINNGEKEYVFREGDYRFIRRNQLIKFIKQPPPDGVFKSISVYLDQPTLRSFAMEQGYQADHAKGQEAGSIIAIKGGSLVKGFMDSLMPYSEDDQLIDDGLQVLKVREAIMILLRSSPVMKDILFDFSEPGKIDLEAFMHKNFHFNVQMNRFAYLTGRSLATFKRDFEHIFHTSPSRWLRQRRLQEAHYLIREKGRTASDVYLEIGFEDLSHFSFAFKKMYGVSPSRLAG
ncbi:AraC family transcriptional regulator [Dyadobacter sp. CY261]|uniref:helix-turn-helix domain-containing protein n=1 Tax=Dyadobacter sp. CY261 TaxID=2907203 RepID=UPI001F2A8233|nr:AraC family transcriptional regulator [Dyadobacter sp. CY261]MCF0071074.1 AraC family transcriptional regulator [Dyadobacter sp. CY261]